ncbi:MAG: amidohydrolase [Luminiphilus sp.]|nr:amidohydrolase [Luminiphilus sp.]
MIFKRFLLSLVALIVVASLYISTLVSAPVAPSHQVFIGGEVLTMDPDSKIAEAVSVRDGVIDQVGSTVEILALVTEDTDVVDLSGRTLVPGFVDAHGHFPGSGQTAFTVDLNSPPIGDTESIPELLDKLRAFGEKRTDGWLIGSNYDDTLLAEKRHPTRNDLDLVSATRPIAVVHVSGHLMVVNSAALAELHIDETTPDPEGGHIVRDLSSADQRRPNGILEETATHHARDKTLDLSVSDAWQMTKLATAEYLQYGVTTASAGGMPTAIASLLGPMSNYNQMPLRVALFPFFDEVGAGLLAGEITLDDFASGRVRVPRVKIIADGSIQGFTGYLSQPYHRSHKGDADYRGYPAVPRDALFEQVAGLYRQRIQVAIHGNGDASIEDALDAIEAAAAKYPWPEARPLIIHAQMTRKDQIARMAALGVTPSFFSAHTFFWGDRHAGIFMGPERAANMSPAKWAQEAGVRFSSHMDTPVTPMRPLQAVWSPVERKTKTGVVLGPDQRIDRMTALRAVTIDAAWQVFMDDQVGSIEPGKLADLVVLSGSPLTAPDLRDLLVDMTVIEGVTHFER